MASCLLFEDKRHIGPVRIAKDRRHIDRIHEIRRR